MSEPTPVRDQLHKVLGDLKVLGEEIRVQIHLASMDARDHWNEELEPKLRDLEAQAQTAGDHAVDALGHLAQDLEKAFTNLRDRLRKA